jgi:hypothetical protein
LAIKDHLSSREQYSRAVEWGEEKRSSSGGWQKYRVEEAQKDKKGNKKGLYCREEGKKVARGAVEQKSNRRTGKEQ